MPSPLMLPAAVERAAAAARHGWGPTPTLADLPSLAAAQTGMHAARLLTPYVTAHARLPGFTGGDLRAALAPGGRLVKIRCMRRTLHLWPLDQAADAHAATLRLRLRAADPSAGRYWTSSARKARWTGPR